MALCRRYSPYISILAVFFALFTSYQTPERCTSSEDVSRHHSGVRSMTTASPSATASTGSSSVGVNLDGLPPGPTAQPALTECDLPLEMMAPTTPPTPTSFPSLHPMPTLELSDTLASQVRSASLRRATSQCGQVISDQLANASARLQYCPDYARSVMEGGREYLDGPFSPRNCNSVWFTPSEACDLLQGIGKLILFVGDSIGRQLQQGLFTVLTGSYTHGGVPKFSFEEAQGECTCDVGYHFPCRSKTYAQYTGPAHLVCPRWRDTYVGTHLSLHDAEYFKEHDAEVYGVMRVGDGDSYRGSIIVLGLGLHDSLDAPFLIRDVYQPAIERARTFQGARVICMLLPAPDEAKKPQEFRETQGVRSIGAFNDKLRKFCRGQGVEVFEMFAPTINATSYDGTHFALAPNALMGQLFLNQLVHKEWEAATRVFGEGFL